MDSAVDAGRQDVSAAAAAAAAATAAAAVALQVLATQPPADTDQCRQRSALSPHVSPCSHAHSRICLCLFHVSPQLPRLFPLVLPLCLVRHVWTHGVTQHARPVADASTAAKEHPRATRQETR